MNYWKGSMTIAFPINGQLFSLKQDRRDFSLDFARRDRKSELWGDHNLSLSAIGRVDTDDKQAGLLIGAASDRYPPLIPPPRKGILYDRRLRNAARSVAFTNSTRNTDCAIGPDRRNLPSRVSFQHCPWSISGCRRRAHDII
ncbi:hypothetical protein FHR22_002090 [Sphingopyxis panaciterrae]|uniref:hypothetical protein n=1 Tax=Sphingopyxis panaciterrae TaxID=363841 RepID=UPI0014227364|nr:hypothetical protein [Sphingopyxis panaciterrae]NIJ37406.1 hypothetical protein [Sphingopyxis panaciterrae]